MRTSNKVFYPGNWVRVMGVLLAITNIVQAQNTPTTPAPEPATTAKKQAAKSERAWQLTNSVGAYETIGNRDPKWDAPAIAALTAYARIRSGANPGNEELTIATNTQAAMAAGCNDPLINYLNVEFAQSHKDLAPEVFGGDPTRLADLYKKAAEDLNVSHYPEIHKFHAFLASAKNLEELNRNSIHPTETTKAERYRQAAVGHLFQALNDGHVPENEIYADCDSLFTFLYFEPEGELESAYHLIETSLSNRYERSFGLLIKAMFHLRSAWQARDSGDVETVVARKYFQRINAAESALDEAWKLSPNQPLIATMMLRVGIGKGIKRDGMEMWFERAMHLDTNNLAACEIMFCYLEPGWYGSRPEARAFCLKCQTNNAWGGKVPLLVAYAFKSLKGSQEEYSYNEAMSSAGKGLQETKPLNMPDELKEIVDFAEVDAAFKQYLQQNTNDIIERQEYVACAQLASRWDVVKQQLSLLAGVHYVDILGEDFYYNDLVRRANGIPLPVNNPWKNIPPEPPHIPWHLVRKEQFVRPGQKVVIDLGNWREPSYSYQWRLNGINIVNATNAKYVIESATPKDAGHYTTLVTNLGGSVIYSNILLHVINPDAWKTIPPIIAIQPHGQTVAAGQRAGMTVFVRADIVGAPKKPSFGYQWRLNGKDIPFKTNLMFALQDGPFMKQVRFGYVIPAASPEDAGEYSIVITNDSSGLSVTSSNALLIVK